MLVFISDLHYRDEEAFTVSPHMTEGFVKKSLVPQVQDAQANEVTVVFLGDLLDINRSRLWVDGVSGGYKPWSHWKQTLAALRSDPSKGDSAFDPSRFEQTILQILDGIKGASETSYQWWQKFKSLDPSVWGNGGFRPQKVSFQFVPGNHDRLAQYSPTVHQRVSDHLSLDRDKASAPFDWIGIYPEYSVIALHGHLFDSSNYGGGKTFPDNPLVSPWYHYPSLGDVVTVTFGVELAHRFAQIPRVALNPGLVPSIAEIDLVRPQTSAMRWLAKWQLTQDRSIASALDEIVVGLIAQFMREQFVKEWLGWFLKFLYSVGVVRPKNVEQAFGLFDRLGGGATSTKDYETSMVKATASGPFAGWVRENYPEMRYVITGHTHRPCVVSLSGDAGKDVKNERLYFNTGTWLDMLEEGRSAQGGFARRQQITHVTFYKEGEDRKPNQRRSYWEFWQGNLREG